MNRSVHFIRLSWSILATFLVNGAYGGWVSDGVLNAAPDVTSLSPSLVFNGTTPYAVWSIDDGSNYYLNCAYYNGSAWTGTITTATSSSNPRTTFWGTSIYMTDYYGSPTQVFVQHFNGVSWTMDSASLNINVNEYANRPAITNDGTWPYVAWREYGGTSWKIRVKRFNGSAWVNVGGPANVNANVDVDQPSICFAAGTPYAAWVEYPNPSTVYVRYYNGASWVTAGSGLNVNTNSNAQRPDLAVHNGTPWVSWIEYSPSRLYVARYNGGNWETVGGAVNLNINVYGTRPSLAFSGAVPYVAWTAFEPLGQVLVHHYNGSSWVQDGGALNVNLTANASEPFLTYGNGTLYATWLETDPGGYDRAYVAHWEAGGTSTATPTGSRTATSTPSSSPSATPTRTATVTPSVTRTSTLSHTPTASPTATLSPTAPPGTFTNTPTTTFTPSRTVSVTLSPVLSSTPSRTLTPTPSVSPVFSPTRVLPTITPTISGTPGPLTGSFYPERHVVHIPRGEQARFRLVLARPGQVRLDIFDLSGRRVGRVAEGILPAGSTLLVWDVQGMSAGLYMAVCETEEGQSRAKIVLVR